MFDDCAARLIHAVVDAFDLGDADAVAAEPMVGSTNRLWRLRTDRGDFVLKEFAYDSASRLPGRQRAAAFERKVYEAGTVLIPEPIPARVGEFVLALPGQPS